MSDTDEQDVQARISAVIGESNKFSNMLEACKDAWARLAVITVFRNLARASGVSIKVQPENHATDVSLQAFVEYRKNTIAAFLETNFEDDDIQSFLQAKKQEVEEAVRQQLLKTAVEQLGGKPVVGRYSAAHLAEDTPGSDYFMGRSRV